MTRPGWALLIGSIVTGVAGRLLGLDEIVVLGLSGLGLLAASASWLRVRRTGVEITRRLSPSQVTVGDDVTVKLTVHNSGTRRSLAVTLIDVISTHHAADMSDRPRAEIPVEPIAAGASLTATYLLAAPRRGLVTLGPMTMMTGDPFGLFIHEVLVAEVEQLLVLPRVDHVAPPGGGRGDDLIGVASRTVMPSPSGEEFATLRAYVPGDDLRKVHWATSARRDKLMVRRDDRLWQTRCTVILDCRAVVHDDWTMEAAVSAAASIVSAATRRGDEVRLVTTSGIDSLAGSGAGHLSTLLKDLALVLPSHSGSLAATFGALRGALTNGTLVVVTSGSAEATNLSTTHRLRTPMVMVVCNTHASGEPEGSRRRWDGRGSITVPVDPHLPFAESWAQVMGRVRVDLPGQVS